MTVLLCALGLAQVAGGAERVRVYNAAPSGLTTRASEKVSVGRDGEVVRLGNGFLTAEISARSGVLRAVENRVAGERRAIAGDVAGVTVDGVAWSTSEATPKKLRVSDERGGDGVAAVTFTDGPIRIRYTLRPGDFWLKRELSVAREESYTVGRIVYGRLRVEGVDARTLQLGKFDRPKLTGNLFAGVGHWFYSVGDDGVYANDNAAWEQVGEFVAEPFYVGVTAPERGEAFAGWLWYRTYLQQSAAASAKHSSWFGWNAGWGQWGIEIDDPAAAGYLRFMHRLGITGVIFGSGGGGKGIGKYNELARSDPVARSNVALLKELGIAGGTLNHGGKDWGEASALAPLLDELRGHVGAGFRATAFDFFKTPDTYVAHRRVAEYFRAAHDLLEYSECHLGMAAYGPQFQRLVRVNHPDDIAGFDISHFSADWATFLAFRKSRREWQKKYDYLMPEDGLYYYLTHYSNWGNPRRYTDPEPQQFLWRVPAYCGIGFNFHDAYGWRESIAAASAFTTCPVFGHIDPKMPAKDAAFATAFFAWMKEHAELLRESRVCVETEDYCVVSKVRDGKGLIYVVNYSPAARDIDLAFDLGGSPPAPVRQVYPRVAERVRLAAGESVPVRVRGESTVIFEVGEVLKSTPPSNADLFRADVVLAEIGKGAWTDRFDVPADPALDQADDANLPKQLISLDQIQDSRPELLTKIPDAEGGAAVKWIGKGKLPGPFLKAYGFNPDGQTIATWRAVPWAFPNRLWLVVRPARPIPLTGPHPTVVVNGTNVELVPRVDHRFDHLEEWNCPLYHADVTGVAGPGGAVNVGISVPGQEVPPLVYVVSAADRK